MKTKILSVILFFFCAIFLFPKENPWGNLKKIHFYDSINSKQKVEEYLGLINFSDVTRKEQKAIAGQLLHFGDHYFEKKEYKLAESFYRKALDVSTPDDFWFIYNKLGNIQREKGKTFISLKNLFIQMFLALKNFKTSFIFFNQFLNVLFFAGIWAFFLYSAFLLLKYFRLAGNDLVIGKGGKGALHRIVIVLVILLWPAVLISGWSIYPFLIVGFLWLYLNENEQLAVKYMLVSLVLLTLLFSINLKLERNIQTEEFKRMQKVFTGHRYKKDVYRSFDNDLKVAQAFAYYENGVLDTALDILNSTEDGFKSTQKLNLIGNIYFRYGEIEQSIKYYSDSLQLNDKNKVALNNFTLALLKDKNPDVFKSYADRYPEIVKLRAKVKDIKDIKLDQGVLWKRLFSSNRESFNPMWFIKDVAREFFKLPIIYYIFLFILYVFGLKKLVPAIGESTYCSKCTKIIKEASVHKSYKLCDECYQLFSIKDVIFLEAKILKEKELKKRLKKKYIFSLIFSLLIPGLNFNNRGKYRLFLLTSVIFYFLLGYSVLGIVNFNRIYSYSPLFFYVLGIISIGFYFLVNVFSVIGEEDGF